LESSTLLFHLLNSKLIRFAIGVGYFSKDKRENAAQIDRQCDGWQLFLQKLFFGKKAAGGRQRLCGKGRLGDFNLPNVSYF